MNQLYYWMQEATPKQREILARKAETSVAYLRQLASGYRKASMEMAMKIEIATKRGMGKEFGDLPFVKRVFLNTQWRKA